ncbi:glycine betaine ABC transporter substrate-binding protein [Nocardia asteroides]|uniref:glycine betaine ABC transporter substrate-binding protein n=1 Tax=Nocardia asteroides TaxID=1824 RepID=UPI001E477E7C|nr:glycine betaine ABC transporter substrate-binding protein [Nocardia asteroides]UGT64197.1 transporter [Nocardia asteroides]
MELPALARRTALIPALLAFAAVVSCGDGVGESVVTVGAGDTAESAVLAEIYAGALSRGGIPAEVSPAPGDRGARLAALDSGSIDLLADHTGALTRFFDATALSTIASPDGGAPTPGTSADPVKTAAAALARSLPQGIVVSDPADGTDVRPRLLVGTDTARLESRTDPESVMAICAARTGGLAPALGLLDPAPPETLPSCIFATTERFADPAALRAALLEGRIGAGILAGPVPADSTAGSTVIADATVPAENVVPVFRDGVLDDRGRERLNQVAGELTTDELVTLVQRAEAGDSPADLARSWLDAHAL